MTPIVMLGKEIFQPASKELLKQLKKWGAKVIPKKEETPAVKAKAKTVTKENISDQHPGMIRKIPTGKRSMSEAQMKKAVKEGGVPRYDTTKPIPRLGPTPVGGKLTAGESRGVLDRAKKNVKRQPIKKKKGGPIKGKPVNGITRAGKPVNGIKGTKVAKAGWMSGLTSEQIKQILGAPTADPSGVVRHSKKKKKKPTKVRKANRGGMTGEGLYPAEEARSGTMSQVRRKKYMKKGGKVISYKMTGGQVVGAGYD